MGSDQWDLVLPIIQSRDATIVRGELGLARRRPARPLPAGPVIGRSQPLGKTGFRIAEGFVQLALNKSYSTG